MAVKQVVRTIVEAVRPKRIVLFGSRARGEAGPDSDLDLMVEMDTDLRPVERMLEVCELFPLRRWPLDVVVYTPAEIARDRNVVGTMLHMIETDGRTLYDESRVPA